MKITAEPQGVESPAGNAGEAACTVLSADVLARKS